MALKTNCELSPASLNYDQRKYSTVFIQKWRGINRQTIPITSIRFWEWLAYPKWYVEDCTVHSPARPHSLALNRNSHEFSREGIISCTAGRRPAAAPLQETSGCDRRANCYGDIPSARHHPLVSRRGHPWSRWAHRSPNSSKIFQSCLLRPFVLSLPESYCML